MAHHSLGLSSRCAVSVLGAVMSDRNRVHLTCGGRCIRHAHWCLHIKTECAMCLGELLSVGKQGGLLGGGGTWSLRWALDDRKDFHRQK